jgi:Tfp pilus assembly protein PilF
VHKNIGSIYMKRNRADLAAHHLRRSLELDPDQPQAEQMRYALSQVEHAAAPPGESPDGPVTRSAPGPP